MRFSSLAFSLLVISILIFSATPVSGNSITTSVTCQLWGSPALITGRSYCSSGTPPPTSGPPPPYAAATASASLKLPTTADGWVTINLSTSIFGTDAAAYLDSIGQLPPGYARAPSSGTASADLHFDLYTDGPGRVGIYQIRLNPDASTTVLANDAASIGGNVIIRNTSAFISETDCSNDFFCNVPDPSAPVFYFQLGSPFTVDGNSSAYRVLSESNAYAFADISLQFRLLESDGVTPVVIHTGVPEPGILAMCLLGFGLLRRLWVRKAAATMTASNFFPRNR